MNAEIRPVRTPVEQALVAAIDSVRSKFKGNPGVAKLRETAAKSFAESGLPHRRIEEWKYTDLRSLLREAVPLAVPPNANAIAEASKLDSLQEVGARRLVLVNGAFVPGLSDLSALEKGLVIVPLAQAMAEGHKLTKRIGELQPETYDAALALNTAFLNDGFLIDIAKDAKIERPIQIVHCSIGKAAASFARSLIVVGVNAKVTVVESFSGSNGIAYQSNSAMEMHVGDGANFNFVRLQAEGDSAIHLSTLLANISANAQFALYPVTTGAAVSRYSISLRFDGKGIEGRFAGANLLRARQHADTTLVLDHAKPNCSSKELIKSVLDGESRGIFQGRIVVKPDAQKTDARMATHALMLSETAESDNKPELEIFADDVQCGHGATSGALDENLMFYFLSRGIPRKEAEALLIQSFVAESIEMIPHEGLRSALLKRAVNWLEART
jgi:Fe-S cluster assembly protein SufD